MVIDDEFDELRREFLGEAAEKVREMRGLVDGDFPPSRESAQRIIYLAHQLKGAGGSYGFPDISSEAASLETEVEAAIDGDQSVAGSIRERIGRLEQATSQ